MMSGVSNLGKALTLVFIFSLLALLSELLYVLWRRHIIFRHRHDQSQTTGDHQPAGELNSLPAGELNSFSSKKDLLSFFCFKTQSRVEPDGSAPTRGPDGSSRDDQTESIDLFKLREMYGPPSRFLFTIKEEEKEDLESDKSVTTRSRNMSQSFDATGASPEFVVTIEEETPFSTPCASPLYFTPSSSPVHQIVGGSRCLS